MSSFAFSQRDLAQDPIACPPRGHGGGDGEQNGNPFTRTTGMLLVLVGMSVVFGVFIAIPLLYNVGSKIRQKRRLVTKTHTASPNRFLTMMERDLIKAPLIHVRRNRPFKPLKNSNVDFGTLPGRLPTLFLLGYTVANIVFTVILIDWRTASFRDFWSDLCNRTGDLSTINMVPLFLTMGRNNPLIHWCDITFDTFNLVHRWIGRIAVVQAAIHTIAWMVKTIGCEEDGLADQGSFLIISGTIAFVPFLFLLFHSPAALRHMFYEFFLYSHIVASVIAIAGLWLHVLEWPLMTRVVQVTVAIWAADRVARLVRFLYANIGLHGISKAQVEILPGDCLRVTIYPIRPWKFHTGQHLYVYMPRSGWFTSHPFSIAWSDEGGDMTTETGTNGRTQSFSLLMKHHTGFTDKLHQQVLNSVTKCITTCFVEGPYGLNECFRSYGTVVLFAGGFGIAHQLPHVRDLVEHYDTDRSLARRVTLIWYIQSAEHVEWIADWIKEIQSLPRCSEVLRIQVFVTRAFKETAPRFDGCMKVTSGRPDMDGLVEEEVKGRVGDMAVATCGAASLADDVRRAARAQMMGVKLDIFEEASTW